MPHFVFDDACNVNASICACLCKQKKRKSIWAEIKTNFWKIENFWKSRDALKNGQLSLPIICIH